MVVPGSKLVFPPQELLELSSEDGRALFVDTATSDGITLFVQHPWIARLQKDADTPIDLLTTFPKCDRLVSSKPDLERGVQVEVASLVNPSMFFGECLHTSKSV